MYDLRKIWPFSLFGGSSPTRAIGVQSSGPSSRSGTLVAPVSFDSSMQLSAVWACVRLLSETVASMPLNLYKWNGSTWEIATDHPIARRLAGKVNRYQTRVEFLETMMLNLTMSGNAYALVERGVTGEIISLLPMMASQVETKLLDDGSVIYCYHHSGGVQVIGADKVWHLKLFGNGIVGLSPLEYAAQAVGIGIAIERRVGEINRNGGKPTGVLTIDKTLTKDQREQARKEFKDLQSGNAETLMVLEAGVKYQQVSMTPEALQLIEQRRFQIEDLARFYGVPSVLINDTSGSTTWGTGIEQIVQGFYKLNLRPYLERIEASANVYLFSDEERGLYALEFEFDAILRPNLKERVEALVAQVNNGLMTPNEARAAEGRVPMAGGEQLITQGANRPLTNIGREPVKG